MVVSPSPPPIPPGASPPLLDPGPAELEALVRDLHREGQPWLPAGQGSRLAWGPPVPAAVPVLRVARLNRILEHNPGDFTLTVEAGTPLAEVREALAPHGQWLALDPPWQGAAGSQRCGSVGGLVARGLAGGYRQRYLGVRDQLIGLRLLRSDGVWARAGGRVVKNVAGYDLMRLFTGSWGSLGLITELTLRTYPVPPRRRGWLVQGSLSELAMLGRWLLGSTLSPERIDWWSAPLAAAAGLAPRPLLLVGLASVNADTIAEQITCLASRTELPSRSVEAGPLEEMLAAARGIGRSPARSPWLLRLGVNPAAVADLLAAPEVEGLAVEMGAGSGLGMAWCPDSAAAPPAPARVAALRRRCRELGGHLTVLVQPPGADLPSWEDAPARPLIQTLKRRFDPKHQLAPGRLPGVAPAGISPQRSITP